MTTAAIVPKRTEMWRSQIMCCTALMIFPLCVLIVRRKIVGIGDFEKVRVTFWIRTLKINKYIDLKF